MERLTRYGDIYNRLAELEDKLKNGTLVEIKPLDMPTWEEVKDTRKRIICDCRLWSISKLGHSIYGLETGKGICAQFAMTKDGYAEACKWIETQRKELIKELCGE